MDVDLRLYALVDPAVAGGRTLADLAGRISSSATLVQLRDKYGSTRAMVETIALTLRSLRKPTASTSARTTWRRPMRGSSLDEGPSSA
jgi:thiamine monophosphate synthase